MRGVNLDVFDFDFDLTWAAFFLSPDEMVYGRYGGRDARSPDSRLSLAGLRYAMAQALAAHRLKNEDRGLRIEDREPKAEDRGTKVEDRKWKIEDRGSRIEDRQKMLPPFRSS